MSQDPSEIPPSTPSTTSPIDYSTPVAGSFFKPAPGPIMETTPEARQWGMICHLSALAGFIIPFASVIAPIIVWMMKKQQFAFVDDQGKEAVNFHITVLIAAIALSPTICIGIGIIVLPALGIASLILIIIAGMRANEGIAYRYPCTLRLVK